VITSCRDIDEPNPKLTPRTDFDTIIKPYATTSYLESPMAKVGRTNKTCKSKALKWYEENNFILSQHILQQPPFNL